MIRRGLTLIEVLLALSLTSILSWVAVDAMGLLLRSDDRARESARWSLAVESLWASIEADVLAGDFDFRADAQDRVVLSPTGLSIRTRDGRTTTRHVRFDERAGTLLVLDEPSQGEPTPTPPALAGVTRFLASISDDGVILSLEVWSATGSSAHRRVLLRGAPS